MSDAVNPSVVVIDRNVMLHIRDVLGSNLDRPFYMSVIMALEIGHDRNP
jgi:hypothetical protein